jgi:transaldolase
MEIMFDTVSLDNIRLGSGIYPFCGVTTNPSILKANGKVDFFTHMRKIRSVIGGEKSLHIQVTALSCEKMVAEAKWLLKNIDDQVYIKIPVTEEGLRAIRVLKAEGVHVTATAIYMKIQGDLAVMAGADYIAPYYNRMENLNINPQETIRHFADIIRQDGLPTKILAASFKNIDQVTKAYESGAHCVTVGPELLHTALNAAYIQGAIHDFAADWISLYGENTSITELPV